MAAKVKKSQRLRKERPHGRSRSGASRGADAAKDLVGVDEAVARLGTTRPTLYRWLRAGRLEGIKVGRQWRFRRRELDRLLSGAGPRLDLPVSIEPLVADLRARIERHGVVPIGDAQLDDVQLAARLLLQLCATLKGSDIHLDTGGREIPVRMRLDGVLQPVTAYDARLHPALAETFKAMAACDVRETALPQSGRLSLDEGDGELRLEVFVAFLPAQGGEAVTLHVLRPEATRRRLDDIGFGGRELATLQRALDAGSGLVLTTGPSGSGKTTTLYSCLHHVAGPRRKVVTVEAPVELAIEGVVQVQSDEARGFTIDKALRAAAQADPDAVMVGEIRDAETAHRCVALALTGKLVLSQLHADDAVGALLRLCEIGLPRYMVADAARAVVAQRLVRRLCEQCREPTPPEPALLRRIQSAVDDAHPASHAPAFHEARGCDACNGTGFRGRAAVYEVLEVTPELRTALRREASREELIAVALGQGMHSLVAAGLDLAARGVTPLSELERVIDLGSGS